MIAYLEYLHREYYERSRTGSLSLNGLRVHRKRRRANERGKLFHRHNLSLLERRSLEMVGDNDRCSFSSIYLRRDSSRERELRGERRQERERRIVVHFFLNLARNSESSGWCDGSDLERNGRL